MNEGVKFTAMLVEGKFNSPFVYQKNLMLNDLKLPVILK